jgi:hypothetical protein
MHFLINRICGANSTRFALSSLLLKNISVYTQPKSSAYPSLSRPAEGRIMIVSYVGQGMRWTRQRRVCGFARQTNDAEADGEVVWS